MAASRVSAVSAFLLRLVDIVLSLLALTFLAPLLVLVAIAVYISDPGPIFFAHMRVGKSGVPFPCLKFRTMVCDAEKRLQEILANDPLQRLIWERDHKLRNDPRITSIGGFMRRSSLDELPQLFNVLRGEMSLVGPRPITAAEAFRYGRYFQRYCWVRPGITGLWQVSGRSDVNYRRRVALDMMFVRENSLALYFFIIAMTIPAVLMARGSR